MPSRVQVTILTSLSHQVTRNIRWGQSWYLQMIRIVALLAWGIFSHDFSVQLVIISKKMNKFSTYSKRQQVARLIQYLLYWNPYLSNNWLVNACCSHPGCLWFGVASFINLHSIWVCGVMSLAVNCHSCSLKFRASSTICFSQFGEYCSQKEFSFKQ